MSAEDGGKRADARFRADTRSAPTIKLSSRLSAIAELVPENARLCDVGTDHGYLPAYLLQWGKIEYAAASDIRQGPLDSAHRTLRAAGVESRARLVLADGLSGLKPSETDCVVIAGMGGETITGILERSVDIITSDMTLILQPMTKAEKLRETLCELKLAITAEKLVLDSGRIYPIIVCIPGEGVPLTKAELFLGKWEYISGEALFPAYLDQQIVRKQKEVNASRRIAAVEILEELSEMRRRLNHADGE